MKRDQKKAGSEKGIIEYVMYFVCEKKYFLGEKKAERIKKRQTNF